MALDDMLDDRKSEPGASQRSTAAGVDAVEALRHPCDVLGRDSFSTVGNRQSHHGAVSLSSHNDGSPGFAITQRIREQVVEQLQDLPAVAGDGWEARVDFSEQRRPAFLRGP